MKLIRKSLGRHLTYFLDRGFAPLNLWQNVGQRLHPFRPMDGCESEILILQNSADRTRENRGFLGNRGVHSRHRNNYCSLKIDTSFGLRPRRHWSMQCLLHLHPAEAVLIIPAEGRFSFLPKRWEIEPVRRKKILIAKITAGESKKQHIWQ